MEILNFFKKLKILIDDFFFFLKATYPLNENNFGWKLMWIAR